MKQKEIRIIPKLIVGYIYSYYQILNNPNENNHLTIHERIRIRRLLNDFIKFNLCMMFWNNTDVFKKQRIMYSVLLNRCKRLEKDIYNSERGFGLRFYEIDHIDLCKFLDENFMGNKKY